MVISRLSSVAPFSNFVFEPVIKVNRNLEFALVNIDNFEKRFVVLAFEEQEPIKPRVPKMLDHGINSKLATVFTGSHLELNLRWEAKTPAEFTTEQRFVPTLSADWADMHVTGTDLSYKGC